MARALVNLGMANGACSGVLVAKNVVVTAAHCKDLLGNANFAVLLTKGSKPKKCNKSRVVEIAYAPGASRILPRRVHAPDILLLRLESDLCSAQPALIQNRPLHPGDVLELTGYGGGSGLWHKSMQISLEVIPLDGATDLSTSKRPYFKKLLELSPDYYVYAVPADRSMTACTGDSGGPLFVNNGGTMDLYAISGAVYPNKNLGADKCNNGYLHLITPIAPHFDWISSQIEAWKLAK